VISQEEKCGKGIAPCIPRGFASQILLTSLKYLRKANLLKDYGRRVDGALWTFELLKCL